MARKEDKLAAPVRERLDFGRGKERCYAARCHDITAGCRGSAGQQLVRNRLRGVFFFALNVWRLGANEQLGWTVQAHGPISRRYCIFSGAGRHSPWLHAFVCAGIPEQHALLCFSGFQQLAGSKLGAPLLTCGPPQVANIYQVLAARSPQPSASVLRHCLVCSF